MSDTDELPSALRLELTRISTQIADLQARALAVAPAEPAVISWGAPVVSVVVLVTYGAMLGCLLRFEIPQSALALSNVMLGTLAAMAGGIVQYWTGASAASKTRDSMLLASTPPAPPVLPPVGR